MMTTQSWFLSMVYTLMDQKMIKKKKKKKNLYLLKKKKKKKKKNFFFFAQNISKKNYIIKGF